MGIDMIINFLDDSITRGAGAARPGEEYVDALNEIVMKNGIDMLTFEEEFPVPTTNTGDELTIDGLHPTSKGHRIIAEKIGAYVRSKQG